MDMKPILLPQHELQARKIRDLRTRGYSDTQIADALGLNPVRLAALLGSMKPAAAPAAKAAKSNGKPSP
jgi:hypothetical protein